MGQTIAVVSGKGGTGKTSFVAGVGCALASLGHKTLCLDCDIGLRNLDIALGLTDRALMDFTDVIRGRCPLGSAVVAHPSLPKLYLLTAPVQPSSPAVTADEMRALLAQINEQFDFCLIDASAGLGDGLRLATCGADRVIVVSTTDPTSLRDAQRTVMELDGFSRGHVHLAVNRIRRKLLKTLHVSIDNAMDAAGLPLIGVIPEDEDMILSLGRETPLLLTNNHCAARAYGNIARRILGERVPLMRIR